MMLQSNSEIGSLTRSGGEDQRIHDSQSVIVLPANKRVSARKRAGFTATTTSISPVSEPTQTGVEPRRKRASRVTPTIDIPPVSEPIRGIPGDVDHAISGNHARGVDVANITEQLVQAQRRRKFAIKQQSQADRSIESLIASCMGFTVGATEKERKQVFARAKAHRLAVEKGGKGDNPSGGALSSLHSMIEVSAANRQLWDHERGNNETNMRDLAKSLPVYSWASGVRGFGELGLAVIYGEAGEPIENYRSVAGLWKRMGLAVVDGERQQKKTDKTLAAVHGYSPKRRSEIWTLADSMSRSQWNGARTRCAHASCAAKPQKFSLDDAGRPVCEACSAVGVPEDIIPAHAAGLYGEVYGRRKAHTLPRVEATADLPPSSREKWTPMRCNNDAKRVMSKALLRDLWRVAHGLPPRGLQESGE